MTNDETPKYPREIRISKPQVGGSDWDILFQRYSRFGIRHSFVLGYLGGSSLPEFFGFLPISGINAGSIDPTPVGSRIDEGI
jgi:hypothetical protein